MSNRSPFRRLDELSRRDLLSLGAKSLLGVSILPFLASDLVAGDPAPVIAAPRPTARNVIYLYMAGGMSHLDTFDPKPGTEVQGPVQALKTSADGLQISEYLPKLASQMHHVAVVRSVTSTQGAHEQGDYYVHTGYTLRGTIRHPALGAWISYLSGRTNSTLPGSVLIGGNSRHPGSGYLESRFAPLPLGNPEAGLQNSTPPTGIDEAHFQRRLQLLDKVNESFQSTFDQKQVRAYRDLYDEAVSLMHSKDLSAFDIAQEPAAIREAYGTDRFGQGCLLARRLIENDVRFVEVVLGGWDTHDDNFERVQDRATILDTALSTLLADLSARGLLEETLVVVATEFGRTPRINGNSGRDHFPKCYSMMLAGGGVKGGQAWGTSDARGENPDRNPVEVPDFNATIGWACGLPITKVVTAPNGRPFTLADKGRPLTGLF